MSAKETVEEVEIGRVMIWPVPPVPVRAFGDVNLSPGGRARLGIQVGFGCDQGGSSLGEQIPGAVVLLVADPDREVGPNPRSGAQPIDPGAGAVTLGHQLADGAAADVGRGGQRLVEPAQERGAVVGEMFPGVFAVEDQGDHAVFGIGAFGGAPADQGEQIIDRGGRGPLRVDEADPIGEGVIAKDDCHVVEEE